MQVAKAALDEAKDMPMVSLQPGNDTLVCCLSAGDCADSFVDRL